MTRKPFTLFALFSALVLTSASCGVASKISKEQAAEIARQKAATLGFSQDQFKLEAVWDKKEWLSYFGQFQYKPTGYDPE
jgi:hypothetical protein